MTTKQRDISYAKSPMAESCLQLVQDLQKTLARELTSLVRDANMHGNIEVFEPILWLRNNGENGGGTRLTTPTNHPFFNAASINVSQVHYEGDVSKPLASATALSTIIHPSHPHCPSMHMHISWTELKEKSGYWRVMADLNPSIPFHEWTQLFEEAIKEAAPDHFDEGQNQGEKYFFIPALQRHRGTSHFYLENFSHNNFQIGRVIASNVGMAVINTYVKILGQAREKFPEATQKDKLAQLAYHTLYFFQVLTLDRGTTSGLLVHDQNDIGILASLPRYVDRELLQSWLPRTHELHQVLLSRILGVIPKLSTALIDDEVKKHLASTLRNFYREYPKAIDILASGYVIPPTAQNHKSL